MLDQFRRLHAARPFTPFTIRLADGGTRTLAAPEHAAVSPTGGAIHLATATGVESIEVSRLAALTPAPARRAAPPPALSAIKLLVFDFDGVWSNNQVLVMQDGTEGVLCNRSDGLGIERLRNAGMPMMVVSKEQNPVVTTRCRKLKVECRQGIDDKLAELNRVAAQMSISLAEMAYVGNDVNDVECMMAVGVAVAVADAYPEAMAAASLVTTRPGGQGAVREVCEWFLAARQASAPAADQPAL